MAAEVEQKHLRQVVFSVVFYPASVAASVGEVMMELVVGGTDAVPLVTRQRNGQIFYKK